MAGMMGQHWLQPDWDPGLTIAHLALSHLTAQGIKAVVLDVDRTLLPGRDVKLPEPVLAWLDLISPKRCRRRIDTFRGFLKGFPVLNTNP